MNIAALKREYKALASLSLTVAFLFPFSVYSSDRKNSGKEVIFFLNQDRLHGNINTINSANKILWKYPNTEKLISFPAKKIDCIELDKKLIPRRLQDNSTINLTNGDFLIGNIISMSEKTLVLNTRFAGNLSIPKVMIKEINYSPLNEFIYYGPNPEDNWKQQNHGKNNKWIDIKHGIMTIPPRYWALLDVKLPDKVQIDYTVIAPRPMTYLQFFFYTVEGETGYFLNQQGSYFELERMTEEEGSDSIENVEMPEAVNKKNMHISLFINKQKKQILLLFNGKIQGTYLDIYGDFAGKGQAIALFNTGRIPVQVTDIKVKKWGGSIPRSNAVLSLPASDTVFFKNNDKTSGKLLGIKNNNVIFTSDFGKFKIPLSRIKSILTAPTNHQLARRNKNDIQLFYLKHGRITINLKIFENNKIFGNSENFGKAELDIKHFSKLRFNIYQERPRYSEANIQNGDDLTNQQENLIPAPAPQMKLKLLDRVEGMDEELKAPEEIEEIK